MNQLPSTPNPGSPPAPSVWFRQSVDYLRALTGRVSAIEARISRPNTGAGLRSAPTPWFLTGLIVGAEARIYMVPAKVNQAVPRMDATSVAAVPAPYLVVTGSSGQIWAEATVDAALAITDLEVENLTSTPTDTSTLYHYLVGTWTSAGGAFTSIVTYPTTNITLRFCAGSPIWEPAA